LDKIDIRWLMGSVSKSSGQQVLTAVAADPSQVLGCGSSA
jgi:hypothetical protein